MKKPKIGDRVLCIDGEENNDTLNTNEIYTIDQITAGHGDSWFINGWFAERFVLLVEDVDFTDILNPRRISLEIPLDRRIFND